MSYHAFQQKFANDIATRLKEKALFNTNASGLFTKYLAGIPLNERQEYNCNCCKAFIEKYGGLVYIQDGQPVSALWEHTNHEYKDAFLRMKREVEDSSILNVFYSNELVWGKPVTGEFVHMYAVNPNVYLNRTRLPHEATALSIELYNSVRLCVFEYSLKTFQTAVKLLESEHLYRSEKVLGQAQFLLDLKKGANLWQAVATAPEGFLHPRASMIATLLDDIQAERTDYAERFAEKMHPLQYQRPTAAPSDGLIKQAEKDFEALGLSRSLERRFARLDEVPCVWKPSMVSIPAESLFGHLRAIPKKTELPSSIMTWVKFQRDVLPGAKSIEAYISNQQTRFSSFVTAVHPDAPNILKWNNSFSWYFYSGGSYPERYSLVPEKYVQVTGIADSPAKGRKEEQEQMMFFLEGARDQRTPSLCLFPEILRSDLHPYKRVIEAYNKSREISHKESSSAAGLFLAKSDTWNLKVRVTNGEYTQEIVIDRWE